MENINPQVIVTAKDEASGILNKFGDTANGVGDSLKKGFTGAAIASGVAIAGLVAESIKSIGAYNEAEAAQKQLEHAVLDVTKASKLQLMQTEELANQIEIKGVLDADNVKIGLAQLSTFGLSNKAVRGLGQSLADLAVNQFGVNASGEQLSETANMIAKALNGQFGVLEKSGIRFTDAQQHIIKFGTEMEKVKAINEGFAQNLKYTNEVALQTTEGRMAKLNVAIGNMEESWGGLISNALLPLLPKLTDLANIVSELISGDYDLADIQGSLTNSFGVLGTAIGKVIGFFVEHKTAAIAVAGAIAGFLSIAVVGLTIAMISFIGVSGPVILAFMAIGAIIAIIIAKWTDISNFFTNLKDTIIKTFNDMASGLAVIWTNITSFVSAMIERIKAIIMSILPVALQVVNALTGGWISQFNMLRSAVEGVMNFISNIVNSFHPNFSIGINLPDIVGAWNNLRNQAHRLGIPGFATGGVVPGSIGQPQLILAHGGEEVVPYNGRSSGGGSGGGTTINLNIGMYAGTETEKRSIAQELYRQLMLLAGSQNKTVAEFMGS